MKYLIISLFLYAGIVQAELVTLDFESDSEGNKFDGFSSNDSSLISFSDSAGNGFSTGSGLFVINAPAAGSIGNSLFLETDADAGFLQIEFAGNANFFSLDFGYDDPRFTNPGDFVVLTLFSGVTQVGQASVVMNRDVAINQTISFGALNGSILFDNATFGYTSPLNNYFTGGGSADIGGIEAVDNVQVNIIPIPAAVWLFGSALAGLGWMRRKQTV